MQGLLVVGEDIANGSQQVKRVMKIAVAAALVDGEYLQQLLPRKQQLPLLQVRIRNFF
ncbi:hypothetical protein GCM10027345_03210 [Hymenobacter daeguensis]